MVGRTHPGPYDEIVVVEADRVAVGSEHGENLCRDVDVVGFAEQNVDVALAPQEVTHGAGDGTFGQHAGRALVEQRLEKVTCTAVDDGHLDGFLLEPTRRVNPREPRTDDHHTGLGRHLSSPMSGR